MKLVCRSAACTRLELHQSRLATSSKLRAEWDRRLEKNAMAVDVLNSNRRLWLKAGGEEPDALISPSEISIDCCNKTVETLHAMLRKHGAQGGLDSFVQDIEVAVKMLKVVSRTLSRACNSFGRRVLLHTFVLILIAHSHGGPKVGNPSARTAFP